MHSAEPSPIALVFDCRSDLACAMMNSSARFKQIFPTVAGASYESVKRKLRLFLAVIRWRRNAGCSSFVPDSDPRQKFADRVQSRRADNDNQTIACGGLGGNLRDRGAAPRPGISQGQNADLHRRL